MLTFHLSLSLISEGPKGTKNDAFSRFIWYKKQPAILFNVFLFSQPAMLYFTHQKSNWYTYLSVTIIDDISIQFVSNTNYST